MELSINQISSLEKVRVNDFNEYKRVESRTVMQGERVSYQIPLSCESHSRYRAEITVESPLAEYVKLYSVKEVFMDMPVTADFPEENYITKEPGFMPDVLVPLEEQKNIISITDKRSVVWVSIEIPRDFKAGDCEVSVNFKITACWGDFNEPVCTEKCKMNLKVIPKAVPEQKLIYTRWFHIDCIASAHNVEIFSDEHWNLIQKYISAAVNTGQNMILVPIHTPPLDTESGWSRPCVQLVDIEKKGETYSFGFEKFHKYIGICKECGVKYYEMAHMFTQWGAKYTPNIMVTENGKTDYLFGWNVPATSQEYSRFLVQYVKAIIAELEKEGIEGSTYFHISDEPTSENIDNYEKALNLIKPLIGKCKIFDALSHIEFYQKELVKVPVTIVSSMEEFLKYDIEEQWAYYCVDPQSVYPNSFMALPSSRLRILGFLLYKFGIKGFLHWGLNFYSSFKSWYPVNPYFSTSADGAFPSGDGFILYPSKDGVYPSIRSEVMYQAIEDMNICFALEEYIGKEGVVELIDSLAGRNVRFNDYPYGNDYVENLRAKIIEEIQKNL